MLTLFNADIMRITVLTIQYLYMTGLKKDFMRGEHILNQL